MEQLGSASKMRCGPRPSIGWGSQCCERRSFLTAQCLWYTRRRRSYGVCARGRAEEQAFSLAWWRHFGHCAARVSTLLRESPFMFSHCESPNRALWIPYRTLLF